MTKFVACIRCHTRLFDEDALFVGYDDDIELYLCLECDVQSNPRLDFPTLMSQKARPVGDRTDDPLIPNAECSFEGRSSILECPQRLLITSRLAVRLCR